MPNFTPDQVAKYNEDCGTICPFCGGKRLEWDRLEWTATGSEGTVGCLDCNKVWVEVMRRFEIINL